MREQVKEKPNYGNWVSKKALYVCAITTIFLIGLSVLFWPFIIGVVLCTIPLIYHVYSYYEFSAKGGDLQSKIRRLILEHVDLDMAGSAIDIGCGNGALAIEVANLPFKTCSV